MQDPTVELFNVLLANEDLEGIYNLWNASQTSTHRRQVITTLIENHFSSLVVMAKVEKLQPNNFRELIDGYDFLVLKKMLDYVYAVQSKEAVKFVVKHILSSGPRVARLAMGYYDGDFFDRIQGEWEYYRLSSKIIVACLNATGNKKAAANMLLALVGLHPENRKELKTLLYNVATEIFHQFIKQTEDNSFVLEGLFRAGPKLIDMVNIYSELPENAKILAFLTRDQN